jgi:hypothetical protein
MAAPRRVSARRGRRASRRPLTRSVERYDWFSVSDIGSIVGMFMSPAAGGVPCCSCFRRWLAIPPLRPASRASSLVHSCAVPF